jgi:hypothetical protein
LKETVMILALIALIAAAPEAPVVVSSLETEQLAESCRGKDSDASQSFCTGYILGAFDTLSMARQICPSPTNASTLEAIAATRKYLRTNRKAWDAAPAFLVRDALKGAFPCKSATKAKPKAKAKANASKSKAKPTRKAASRQRD